MLSRNFRLQKVGDVNWLNRNYNFGHIAESIDELIILNVSRSGGGQEHFLEDAQAVTKNCFVPLTLGGQLRSFSQVEQLITGGADKVVLNSTLFHDSALATEVIRRYGSQCLVASIDYKSVGQKFKVHVNNGEEPLEGEVQSAIAKLTALGVGEIYLNSMERDGTGQGYFMPILDCLPNDFTLPLIMAGGAGNVRHFIEGFADSRVDAVATANLFNFVGDGLPKAREELLAHGVSLASW